MFIAGIGDSGPREKELMAAVQKEFAKLPMEVQQGLREFYQYCDKSIIGLVCMAASLSCIFGEQVETFPEDKMINTNSYDIQAFQDEFKGKKPARLGMKNIYIFQSGPSIPLLN